MIIPIMIPIMIYLVIIPMSMYIFDDNFHVMAINLGNSVICAHCANDNCAILQLGKKIPFDLFNVHCSAN